MRKRMITKCVCHRRSFESIKEYAEEHNINELDELVNLRLCGCGCGMCKPYIKKMLETGTTEFVPGAPIREAVE